MINVNPTPLEISVSPNNKYVYITDDGVIGTVLIIATLNNSLIDTVKVGAAPGGIAIAPNGAYIYIANSGSDTISVLSAISQTSIIPLTNYILALIAIFMIIVIVAYYLINKRNSRT